MSVGLGVDCCRELVKNSLPGFGLWRKIEFGFMSLQSGCHCVPIQRFQADPSFPWTFAQKTSRK